MTTEAREAAASVGAPPLSGGETFETWQSGYVRWLAAIDLVAAAVASSVAYLVRFGDLAHVSLHPVRLALALALVPAWGAVLGLARAYEPRFAGSGYEDIKRLTNATLRLLAVAALVSFAFRLDLARGFVFGALILAASLSLAGRIVLRTVLHRRRRSGRWANRAVVVGSAAAIAGLVRQARARPHDGLLVVGACSTDDDDALLASHDIPGYGGPGAVLTAIRRTNADTVAVAACSEMDGVALRRLAWQLEGTGVHLLVAPSLVDVAGGRIHMRPMAGLPLLHVEQPELTGIRRVVKATVDRSLAAGATAILLPILIAVGLLIRVTSPGPALFRQRRVGRAGREFTMLKFRTMSAGAETAVIDLTDQNIHDGGPLFKVAADPRVTRVGHGLRRFSIDELPQLLNVLRGEMSLVGPRPPLPSEVVRFGEDVHRRFLVKPGLTGLWQVSGRSNLSWDESVRLDLHYVENWSLALDASILTRTVGAVLSRRGAY